MQRPEGTIGGVWNKRLKYVTIYRMAGDGDWKHVVNLDEDDPNYKKLIPVLGLIGPANPTVGTVHAFYFTPEEYKAIMEGP